MLENVMDITDDKAEAKLWENLEGKPFHLSSYTSLYSAMWLFTKVY